MLNEERRQKITEILTQRKRVLVKEISSDFNISEVTIRKDLEILEKRGVLSRVHGGAILKEHRVTDLALTEKERIHPKEKQRMAQKAVEIIEPGDAIILDSGTSTTQIAREIKFKKDIKVITNAINIAAELAASENEVILTGGFLREQSFSLVGPFAEDTLRHMNADKLFLGVDGIHFKYGLTTPNLLEARVNQLMIEIASEVILVADSSKFGKRSMGVISQISAIDKIITDKKIQRDDFNRLNDLGIQIILA